MALQDEMPLAGVTSAGGIVALRVRATKRPLKVMQISTEMPTAPIGSTCEVRKNSSLLFPMFPTGDVASGEPYPRVGLADDFVIQWAGCVPGSLARALVIYEEIS